MEPWKREAADQLIRRLDHEIRTRLGDGRRTSEFQDRLRTHGAALFDAYHQLYGWKWDFPYHLERFILTCADAARSRPKWLRRRDREEASWLTEPATVWAMTYVDRFVDTFDRLADTIDHLHSLGVTHLHLMPPYEVPTPRNDGGYAVQNYRSTRPDLGTIDDLTEAISDLHRAGIGVVLDFVANHTADTHPWAVAAKGGDPFYSDFYFFFPDRTVPDAYAASLREIFPDRPGDAFTWREDVGGGSWVWSTFYEFQWDLDYRNPNVTAAMAGELLGIANLGPQVIRADATPFLWKEMGTTCENLDQAHTVIRILALAAEIVAPSVKLLSEAIVHPDDVIRFVRPDEADLGYNPLTMSSTWEALATRDTALLEIALSTRLALPPGCQWITYLRCHDDIGWGFADEDARSLGIDPFEHRRFLNSFYAGEFPGSFAAGMRFQDNPATGDARISGTLASLAGLEQALETEDPAAIDLAIDRILLLNAFMLTVIGIPLLYLGDEIAQLNDYTYADDPELAHDNRWAHRPAFSWETLAASEQGVGPAGRVLTGVRHLIEARVDLDALGGEDPLPHVVPMDAPELISFDRVSDRQRFRGVFNFSERSVPVSIDDIEWETVFVQSRTESGLGPYGCVWMVRSRPE
jgi:amylosucrase